MISGSHQCFHLLLESFKVVQSKGDSAIVLVSSYRFCPMKNWQSLILALQTFCVTHQLHGLLSDVVRIFYMCDISVCRKLESEKYYLTRKTALQLHTPKFITLISCLTWYEFFTCATFLYAEN